MEKPPRKPKKSKSGNPFYQPFEPKKKVVRNRDIKRLQSLRGTSRPEKKEDNPSADPHKEPIRLNRFIARSGISSRREADELIAKGKIKVNGKVCTELGRKVRIGKDKVEYNDMELNPQRLVYILLNKPKNMITTMQDPLGRKIVLDAIYKATQERVFPVGRLDRNTTGLLLLTNDGDLTEKLTHPSQGISKLYKVRLNRTFEPEDLNALRNGIELDDGPVVIDKIDYVEDMPKTYVGVEIHIGRNRIVRRMFEHLGYQVMSLDRVMLGPLTKRNLPRGKWRKLTDREIGWLKMM